MAHLTSREVAGWMAYNQTETDIEAEEDAERRVRIGESDRIKGKRS